MSNDKQLTAEETLKRKLLRLWYRIWYQGGSDCSEDYHVINGKFRTLYKDGKKSRPCTYRLAKDYAEMFGGTVIDNF